MRRILTSVNTSSNSTARVRQSSVDTSSCDFPMAKCLKTTPVSILCAKAWRRVESRRDEDERCRALFLKKDTESEDATEPLIDMGVYTRNRVFRLYLSNKYSSGESAPKPRLETTERQRFWKTSKDGEKGKKETFMRSLASLCLDLSPKFIAFEGVTHQSVLRSKEFRGYCTGSYLSPTAAAFNGNAGCPCPRTAAFVCEDFNHWSAHAGAAVRSWTAFPGTRLDA